MKAPSYKKMSIKVPAPKAGSRSKQFGGQTAPRKPSAPRIYTKATLKQDPTQFGDFGFGTTGLTGET